MNLRPNSSVIHADLRNTAENVGRRATSVEDAERRLLEAEQCRECT
jgi:hypothetical protein